MKPDEEKAQVLVEDEVKVIKKKKPRKERIKPKKAIKDIFEDLDVRQIKFIAFLKTLSFELSH